MSSNADAKVEVFDAAFAASDAILREAEDALAQLRIEAPEHLVRAKEIKDHIASYIRLAVNGEIDPSVALEACRRETGALELEALRILEKGKQETVVRTRRALDVLADFGLKLAQIAVTVASRSVTGGAIDLGGIFKT